MKRLATAVAVASSLATLAPARADEKVLNLYSWAGIFDDVTLDGFTKATGYKVRFDAFDSDEMLETKLLAGSTGYDVVTPAAIPFLQREITAGAIQKFDPKLVPNVANTDPMIRDLLKMSDPEASHAVVAAWGTTGMGLNVDKIRAVLPDAPLDSYDLMFKPENAEKLSKCGFVMVDSATDIMPIVINYLGLDAREFSEENVDKAMAVLNRIRPYVTYIDSTKYQIELANGAVCAAVGWSGDVTRANKSAEEAKNGVKLRYVVPKEGSIAWLTTLAVPADAPDPQAAFAFLNYLLDPKVAAHMTQVTGFPTPVPQARAFVPADIANDESFFPPDDVKKRLVTGSAQSEKRMRYVNRQWARFRAGG